MPRLITLLVNGGPMLLIQYHNHFRLKMHEERKTKQKKDDQVPEGAVPAYLLDREGQNRAKVLSNMIKQKRKEKAVSWICFLVPV